MGLQNILVIMQYTLAKFVKWRKKEEGRGGRLRRRDMMVKREVYGDMHSQPQPFTLRMFRQAKYGRPT